MPKVLDTAAGQSTEPGWNLSADTSHGIADDTSRRVATEAHRRVFRVSNLLAIELGTSRRTGSECPEAVVHLLIQRMRQRRD